MHWLRQNHLLALALIANLSPLRAAAANKTPTRWRDRVVMFAAKRAAVRKFGAPNLGRIRIAREGAKLRGPAQQLGLPRPSASIGTVHTRRGSFQTFGILNPWVALFRPGQVYWLPGRPDAMTIAMGILRLATSRGEGGSWKVRGGHRTAQRLVDIESELALASLPLQLLTAARHFVISAAQDGLRGNSGDFKPDLIGRDPHKVHFTVVGDRNSVSLRYTLDGRHSRATPPITAALEFNATGNMWFVAPTWTGTEAYGESRAQRVLANALGAAFPGHDKIITELITEQQPFLANVSGRILMQRRSQELSSRQRRRACAAKHHTSALPETPPVSAPPQAGADLPSLTFPPGFPLANHARAVEAGLPLRYLQDAHVERRIPRSGPSTQANNNRRSAGQILCRSCAKCSSVRVRR